MINLFDIKDRDLNKKELSAIKKNKICLFVNARDEPKIVEWIVHHLFLGFDNILIFDHLSKTPIQNIIQNTFGTKVSVVNITEPSNIKIKLMENAVRIAKEYEFNWMLYLDADEYIYLKYISNIKQMLHRFSIQGADAITLNWVMFGSNNLEKEPKGGLMESYTKSDEMLDMHVKTIVKPFKVISVDSPHHYRLKNPNRCFSCLGMRVTSAPFVKTGLKVTDERVNAFIAHYHIQSEETYRKRKGRRNDDGTQANTSNESVKYMMSIHNNMVNTLLKDKYVERVKSYLGKDV